MRGAPERGAISRLRFAEGCNDFARCGGAFNHGRQRHRAFTNLLKRSGFDWPKPSAYPEGVHSQYQRNFVSSSATIWCGRRESNPKDMDFKSRRVSTSPRPPVVLFQGSNKVNLLLTRDFPDAAEPTNGPWQAVPVLLAHDGSIQRAAAPYSRSCGAAIMWWSRADRLLQ